MCRVANKAAADKADEQVDQNDWQEPGAEHALESFRQLAPILDTKQKQHAHQSKQCPGGARRRNVSSVKNKTAESSASERRTNSQVTADCSGNAGNHPEHDKLRRPVKFLDKRPEDQQAEHVHEQVKDTDVYEHRCDEAPPLMIRSVDEVVDLGAVSDEYLLRKVSL